MFEILSAEIGEMVTCHRIAADLSFVFDCAIRFYNPGGSFAAPALHIDCDRILADVRVRPLDIHRECRRQPTQSLRTETGRVDLFQEIPFKLGDQRVCV